MADYTIAIYCFFDDFIKISRPKEDCRRKINDAGIMLTLILAARYFQGNLTSASMYLRQHHGFCPLDKSNLSRHLHRLQHLIEMLFYAFGRSLQELNVESRYIIDSFPVAVCRNIRIKRCKLLKGEAYRGYNASKKEFFYGFKVQLVTTAQGIPVQYFITAGSFHDNTALQAMDIDLPPGAELYADCAYSNYELEDLFIQTQQVNFLVQRKKNSKRPDHPALRFLKKHYRKQIETTFSQINAWFPRKIHAVTPQGFLIKIFAFIFAFTLEQCL